MSDSQQGHTELAWDTKETVWPRAIWTVWESGYNWAGFRSGIENIVKIVLSWPSKKYHSGDFVSASATRVQLEYNIIAFKIRQATQAKVNTPWPTCVTLRPNPPCRKATGTASLPGSSLYLERVHAPQSIEAHSPQSIRRRSGRRSFYNDCTNLKMT